MTYLFLEQADEIAVEWKKYAGYTVRPQSSTVLFYEKYISSLKNNANIFLFGSTPEIRALARNNQTSLTMMDRSELMPHAMGKVIDPLKSLTSHEVVVTSDWLAAFTLPTSYDLAIGDDAINMVAWHSFERFLKNTSDLLNPNAYFLCHLLVKPDDDLIDTTLDNIIHEYDAGKILNRFELASRLNFLFYDKATYCMGWQQTIAGLGEKGLAKIKPYLDFQKLFGKCNSYFYCPPQVEFEMLVEKYFDIEKIFYSTEQDFCAYEPVYVLKKKGS